MVKKTRISEAPDAVTDSVDGALPSRSLGLTRSTRWRRLEARLAFDGAAAAVVADAATGPADAEVPGAPASPVQSLDDARQERVEDTPPAAPQTTPPPVTNVPDATVSEMPETQVLPEPQGNTAPGDEAVSGLPDAEVMADNESAHSEDDLLEDVPDILDTLETEPVSPEEDDGLYMGDLGLSEETEDDALVMPTPPQETYSQIVFIDSQAVDHSNLVSGIADNIDTASEEADSLTDVEMDNDFIVDDVRIIVLNAEQSGIDQISSILETEQGLSALHIVSHGTDGSLLLGSDWLSGSTVSGHADAIAGWRSALCEDADLLLYGCDLTAGEAGVALVERLAELTGADIAASENATGSAALGGDWTLEFELGVVDTSALMADSARWSGLLDPFVVTSLEDSGAGSLREAIRLANTNGNPDSTDTITFQFDRTNPDIWAYRFIYQDDGVEGSIDEANKIQTNQLVENITDIDGDFAHAWYEINLLRPLDTITERVVIDGTNVDGRNGAPNIVIRGDDVGAGNGLTIENGAENSEIRGLTINGFTGNGVVVQAQGVSIVESHIGTDASGFLDVGNTEHGIVISANNATVDDNVISGNDVRGIYVDNFGDNATVTGNLIGVTADGMSELGNGSQGILVEGDDVVIGGSSRASGNVISGNGGDGIQIGAIGSGTKISNNFIGTTITGTGGIGNALDGIRVAEFNSDAGLIITDNVIAANGGHGISFTNVENSVIQGNIIGTGVTGMWSGHSNEAGGIYLTGGSSGNLIGGEEASDGNMIINNGGKGGVYIEGETSTGNAILGNTIFSNNDHAIRLAAEGDGKDDRPNDPLDADTGANDLMNVPEFSEVTVVDGTITAVLEYEAEPLQTYRIEFYRHGDAPVDGSGQLQARIASMEVFSDANGLVTASVDFQALGLEAGQALTATATLITAGQYSSTSEVSRAEVIANGRTANEPPTVEVVDVVINHNEGEQLNYVIPATDPDHDATELTYSWGGADRSRFTLSTNILGVATINFVNNDLPDYEDPNDNGPWFITVTATDPDGASITQSITINVNNVNEQPDVFARSTSVVMEEGTTAITTLTVLDPDDAGARFSEPKDFDWEIATGPNSELFSVVESASTGELSLRFINPPDFETLTEDSYEVTVYATDDGGLRGETTVTVRVVNVNEDPRFQSSNRATIDEGTKGAVGLFAADPETLSKDLVYRIDGGADANMFEVIKNSNGESILKLKDNAQWQSGESNQLTVDVLAVDENFSTTRQTMVVEIVNLNDAPVISGKDLQPTEGVQYLSGATDGSPVLQSIPATDADGDSLKYSIIGGTDREIFAIDPDTGALTFSTAPDPSNVADSNGDNYYQVIVNVTDGNGGRDTMIYEVTPRPAPSDNGGSDVDPEGPVIETEDPDPLPETTGDGFDGQGPFNTDLEEEIDLDKETAGDEVEDNDDEDDAGSMDSAEEVAQIEPLISFPDVVLNENQEVPVDQLLHAVRHDIRELTTAVSEHISIAGNQEALALDLYGDVSEFMFVGELVPLDIDDGGVIINRVSAIAHIEQVSASLDSLIGNMVDQMQEEAAVLLGSPVVAGVVVGATVSLSLGYVSWLLRFGYLLTGVLAFLPGLRLLDPIAVLSAADNDSKGDDLAQMSDADREVRSIFSQARLDLEQEELLES